MSHNLEQERALADAGFSPHEDNGAGDDPTAQNPVQLPYPSVHPAPALDDGNLAEDHSPTRDPGLLPGRPLGETDDLLALAHLLHEGAPPPAIRAPPEPLGRLMAAVRTDVKRFRSHDPIVLDRRKSTANKRSVPSKQSKSYTSLY